MAASLLIECRGSTEEDLKARIEEIQTALRKSGLPFGAKAAGACGRDAVQGSPACCAAALHPLPVVSHLSGGWRSRGLLTRVVSSVCFSILQSRSRWRPTSSSTSPRTLRYVRGGGYESGAFQCHSSRATASCGCGLLIAFLVTVAGVLGRAPRADPHRGRRPQAGHVDAA